MFDFQTEITVRQQEREREIRTALLAAAATANRSRGSLRAPVAGALARLALALHRDTAAGVVADARERAGQASA